jgi:hypothetical protein
MDALGTIRRLASGHMLEDLAEALSRVAEEVAETGKPGAVSLKLSVKPLGEPGSVMIAIEEEIGRTPPKRSRGGSIFYSVNGGLYSEDPRQTRLPFRRVDTPESDVREPGSEPATVREG